MDNIVINITELPEVVAISIQEGAAPGYVSAGASSMQLGLLLFSNQNNVSFGFSNGIITASANGGGGGGGGGVAISAGANSFSSGTIQFSNQNGVSFGLDTNGMMTGSVATNYQSQGNYLTTAMQSQQSSVFAKTGFSSTTIVGSNIQGTHDTNGLNLAIPNFLTTTPAQTAFLFSNSNGVTFGTNGSTVTASVQTNYQSTGNYLTTAMQSQSSSVFAKTGFSSTSTVGSNIVATHDTNGLSMGIPNFITAAGGAQTGVSGISAGTTQATSGTVSFANSNGISFGMNGNTLTATVQTNYLTTAMQSQSSSVFAKTGFTSTSTVGSNIVATHDTNGLSMGVPNFLTTAMQSNAVTLSNINVSAGASNANLSALTFSNGSGVSFGLSNGVITASVAAAGGAQTGISALSAGTTQMTSGTASFANSNGVSFGINGNTITATVATNYQSQGAYLTTAAQSNQVVNSVNGSVGQISLNVGSSLSSSTAGSSITFGLASNITTALQSAGNYLTTAAQSNQVVNSVNGSTGQISLNVGSSLSSSVNGNSMTFGLASNITTALQSTGAYLTTARASTDAIGLNTAQSNVTWTVNSSGLSLDARGYAGTGFSGTNASATFNSNGLQLSIAAPGGGGGTTNQTGPNIADGNGNTITSGTVVFSNLNNVSFGLNGSTMTASVVPQSNQTLGAFILGNTTQGTSGTFDARSYSFSVGGPGVSMGFSNGSIVLSNPPHISSYENIPDGVNQTMTFNGASISQVVGFFIPEPVSAAFIRIPVLMTMQSTALATNGASTTGSAQGGIFSTFNAVVYSLGTGANSTQLFSVANGSNTWAFTNKVSLSNSTQYSISQGLSFNVQAGGTSFSTQYSASTSNISFVTTNFTAWSSNRFLDIDFVNSLTPGPYFVVIGYSSSSSSAGAGIPAGIQTVGAKYSNHYGASQTNLVWALMGSTNQTSVNMAAGSFSTAGGGTVANFPISAISSLASQMKMYFQMRNTG